MTYTDQQGKSHKVRQTGRAFFFWSERAVRWLPVAKSKVSFS